MKSNNELPLRFGMTTGGQWLDTVVIHNCKSYQDAVRTCWAFRKIKGMTKRTLAELAGLYAPHVTDYLSDKDGKRNLPAEKIADFEAVCGNYAITQWEMNQRGLHIMEKMIERKSA